MTAEIPQNVKIAVREVLKIVDYAPWALAFDLAGKADPKLYSAIARQFFESFDRRVRRAGEPRLPVAMIWFSHELRGVRPITTPQDLLTEIDADPRAGTDVDLAIKTAAEHGATKLVVVTDGWVGIHPPNVSFKNPGAGGITEIFWVIWDHQGRMDLPGLSLPMYAMHEPEKPDFDRPVYAIGSNHEGGIDWLNPMLPCRVIARNRISTNHWSYVLLARDVDGPKGDQEHVLICNPETGEAASQFRSYRIINKLRPA